jgi:multidrug efflux pump
VLYLLGASAKTIGFARQYVIYVVIAGNVPVILSMTCGHLLRNAGYSRQASIGMSGGGILNIILDPLFMFVIFPKGQEVTGAAVATLISNIVSCIYLIAVMHRYSHASHLSVRLSDAFALSRELIGRLFAVGVPSAVLTGLFDVANIFLNALMAAHGDLQLAAIGIVMKAERLPNALNVGLCQGMVPLVAYSYSRGMTARMNEIIKRVRIYGIIIGTASFVLFEALAPQVVHIFLSTSAGDVEGSTAAIAFATVFLRIRCAAPLPQFFNYSTSFTLQAVGDGKDTLIHAAVRELVFYIPFMFILNRLFGTYGLVSAVVIGEACGAAFAFLLLHLWKRKNIPTVSGDISVHK